MRPCIVRVACHTTALHATFSSKDEVCLQLGRFLTPPPAHLLPTNYVHREGAARRGDAGHGEGVAGGGEAGRGGQGTAG